ncbi:hypothetical protein OIU85_002664 [Salix viminalis]|uniref:Leucine-rich repeat-containing N-terminal plant-type domain-containing protein n=1 Tax=Salix viminalis TaxID=40686 RepID=A0A9Q0VP85_SALVM|nr:hypothetical protein OIU85_002664 [Salix viminalis]
MASLLISSVPEKLFCPSFSMLCFHFVFIRSLSAEGVFLLEFRKSVIDSDNNLQSWNSLDSTPCIWKGVGCSTNLEVTSLNLHSLNLSGSLSTIATIFQCLLQLLSGPIPQCLGECRSLEILDLCANKFHGEFPAHLCSLNTLKLLYFCENYIFGEISREIGNLTSLVELVIYNNNLTGTIPASIRELKHLRVIWASVNSFTGPIPPEISECESLEILRLAMNSFQGSLPKELQKLQNLTNLILEGKHFYLGRFLLR